jgi:hypothetical protein
MKFETLMLRGLFVASMLVCGLIMTAMVTTRSTPLRVAASRSLAALLISAPSSCMLPFVDDMICARATI